MNISEHFTRAELACKGNGDLILADGFLDRLEALRRAYGEPMLVTSGCRSPEHNKAIGGHPRSLHLTESGHGMGTCAVDIGRPPGFRLHKLLEVATLKGWTVGIADTFIHLDRRIDYINKPATIYTYG